MKTLLMIIAVSLVSGCGGSECHTELTRTKIISDEGTHWIVCSSWQCQGFPTENRCHVE
jgi:hypothetical protein